MSRDNRPAVFMCSDDLEVAVDTRRGGVIRSIRSRRLGRELLFQAHWTPAPLVDAASSELEWTKAWAGGWNVLFPNAGAACRVGDRRYSFHGAASVSPWQTVGEATVRWEDGHGLSIERSFTLEGPRLTVCNVVANAGATIMPYLLVEHIVFGGGLVAADAVVELHGGTILPLADDGPPLPAPAMSSRWPRARRGCGIEDWSRRPGRPASRFGAITLLPERTLRVTSEARGTGVVMRWSSSFPHLWFWEEQSRYTDLPWDARVRCLALEPSTVSTGEGLAAAVARGEAPTLAPGRRAVSWVELEVQAEDTAEGAR